MQDDAHTVAGLDTDPRTRHLAVVRPRGDGRLRVDLPVDDLRRQFELLGAVGQHIGLEGRVADAFGVRAFGELRDVRVDGRFHGGVAGVVLFQEPFGVHAVGAVVALTDVEVTGHAGLFVAGNLAVHRVQPGFELRHVELGGRTRGEVGRHEVGPQDAEVVHRGSRIGDGQLPAHRNRDRVGRERELAQRNRRVSCRRGCSAALVVVERDDEQDAERDGDRHDGQRKRAGTHCFSIFTSEQRHSDQPIRIHER